MKEPNNVSTDKMVVSVGYKEYVMDAETALVVVRALATAEVYERKLNPERDKVKGADGYLHYVYENDTQASRMTMEYMPSRLYQMAKLAGKPDQNL